MRGKYVLLETGLLEKALTIKRFEYSLLGIELKKQTDIAKERYQGLDKVYEFDNKEDREKTYPTVKNEQLKGVINEI